MECDCVICDMEKSCRRRRLRLPVLELQYGEANGWVPNTFVFLPINSEWITSGVLEVLKFRVASTVGKTSQSELAEIVMKTNGCPFDCVCPQRKFWIRQCKLPSESRNVDKQIKVK